MNPPSLFFFKTGSKDHFITHSVLDHSKQEVGSSVSQLSPRQWVGRVRAGVPMDPISEGQNPYDKQYPEARWFPSWAAHEGWGSQAFMSTD